MVYGFIDDDGRYRCDHFLSSAELPNDWRVEDIDDDEASDITLKSKDDNQLEKSMVTVHQKRRRYESLQELCPSCGEDECKSCIALLTPGLAYKLHKSPATAL